jgi:AcrR family transcriptional regulator
MPRPSDPAAKVKLLAAAEAVFVARGLDGAKVEEITERAGLAKGSFYLHFGGKEDAFRELVQAMLARLQAHLEAIPDDCTSAGADVGEFLDRWVRQDAEIFEFVWQNRGLCGLLLEGGKSAAYRHLVDEFSDRAAFKVRAQLQRGVEAGFYRDDLDVDVGAAFIAGAYDRLARQIVRSDRRPDLQKMLRKVQFLVLRGIASASMLDELSHAGKRAGKNGTSPTDRRPPRPNRAGPVSQKRKRARR